MHHDVNNGLIRPFSLTGTPCQEGINLEKYETLVYQTNERGQALRVLVEKEWTSWQRIVAEAPWLKNWQNADEFDQRGLTPYGFEATTMLSLPISVKDPITGKLTKAQVDVSGIAQTIYSDATWGFAIDHWLQYPWGIEEGKRKGSTSPTLMQQKIMDHQKLKVLPVNRKATWDDKIYRGTGMLIPLEYGDFDRWLEGLWLKVIREVG